MLQNMNICELLQPEEESFDDNGLLPGLDNQRWITVEQDDAGEEDETVLYRTFVNAAIGGKRHRIRSRGAPYMLILSTKNGESQPKVTICNQSGTISLTRDFAPEDLQDQGMSTSPSAGDVDVRDGIPLNFGRMNITVAFLDHNEQQKFMDLPRSYFDAVRRREPRQLESATETLLFDRSVEEFEQVKPSKLKPLSPRQQFRSCDLRILETTGKEGWRTTRRLVISSSAGEKRPWCTEMFLPLSNVRISRGGTARGAVITWSDCSHERSSQTDGNYNRIYSYVYDENTPNVALRFLFRNSADATDFENTVLKLSSPPILSWSNGPDSRHVYDLSDNGSNPKSYKGILLTHTSFQWKYSELFYMYRDTDYIDERASARVRFPQVYYTDYVSSHVEKLYKPDTLPHFSHCEKRIGTTTVDCEREELGFKFMSSLTAGHELIFSRRVLFVATKTPSKWRSAKSSKHPAVVQLWRKASIGIQLLTRSEDKVEDKWMSLPLQKGALEQAIDTNRVSLPRVEYQRGTKVDMAALVAMDSRERGAVNSKVGPVTICFESVRDREEFAAAVGGMAPLSETSKSPLDQLMEFG